jgi:predicted transcriptional regulator
VNVTVKMPPDMKIALEKLAEKDFSSVSAILKKSAEKYLLENGIDWRKVGVKEKSEK